MCIRDRPQETHENGDAGDLAAVPSRVCGLAECSAEEGQCPCLLYTSDAADERSSVDLGGRRIIKKKTTSVMTEAADSRHQ